MSRGKYAYFGEKSGQRQGQAKHRSGILRQQNKQGCLPGLKVPHGRAVGDCEKGCPEAIPCAQHLISDIQPAEGFYGKLVASPTQAAGDCEKGCPEAIPWAQHLISDIHPAEGFGGKLVVSPTQAVGR